MAKIKTEEKTLERVYNVPLRKEFLKVSRWRRTEKAVTALRKFLKRHMKTEEVRIGKDVNEKLWQHGIKNPPHHIKVNVSKNKEGVVTTTLFGVEKKEPKEKKAQKKAPAATEKKKEAKEGKTEN